MSIQETTSRNEEHQQNNDESNLMNMVVKVSQQEEGKPLGIVIVASQGNNTLDVWATRERSIGDSMLDYAAAIKLTPCKAREKLWKEVKVIVSSAQLIRCLRTNKAQDISLVAQLEGIQMLKSLFTECSFSLIDHKCNMLSRRITAYATKLVQNEEYLNPQCLGTLL